MSTSQVNPEKDQDRVFDLFEMFNAHNRVMFSQQETIYRNLFEYYVWCDKLTLLEAGCGTGQGTALLSRVAMEIVGTDKLQRNVDFARAIYPWIEFETWDLNEPSHLRAPIVVCVETFEHVANPQRAMNHLLEATGKTLWLSTPNGTNKPRPPENPYHVCEYTPYEIVEFIATCRRGPHKVVPRCGGTIRHWETWEPLAIDTLVDPLVYEIQK